MTAPYYQDDHITLYHGDALEVMAAMPDESPLRHLPPLPHHTSPGGPMTAYDGHTPTNAAERLRASLAAGRAEAIKAKALELHAEHCPIKDCTLGATARWLHWAEEVLHGEAARAETTTATTEDAAKVLLAHFWDASDEQLCTCGESPEDYDGDEDDDETWLMWANWHGTHVAQALHAHGLLATARTETTATTEDAARVLTDIEAAVEDYRTVFPTPEPLPPNLDLAVRAARLLARPTPSRDQIVAAIGDAANSTQIGFGVVSINAATDAVLALLEGGGDE